VSGLSARLMIPHATDQALPELELAAGTAMTTAATAMTIAAARASLERFMLVMNAHDARPLRQHLNRGSPVWVQPPADRPHVHVHRTLLVVH